MEENLWWSSEGGLEEMERPEGGAVCSPRFWLVSHTATLSPPDPLHPTPVPDSAVVALQLGTVKMADGTEDPAVFTSASLPSDPRLLATVTNAYLGTRVYRDILHVNGVYNGAVGDTHRADVPSPVNVRMAVPGADSLAETFTLNTRTGKQQSSGGDLPVLWPPVRFSSQAPIALSL